MTAALDLVGPDIPKGTVLLASIIPGLVTKIFVPYVMHLISYSTRIIGFAGLSTCGMLAVALSPGRSAGSIAAKLVGIILANISAGAGEAHFLSLVHFYGQTSLAAWGSGTGGAGMIGAGAYALATTVFGLSVQTTLVMSATLPVLMLLSYFVLLPPAPLIGKRPTPLMRAEDDIISDDDDADGEPGQREADGLLAPPNGSTTSLRASHYDGSDPKAILQSIRDRLSRTRPLLIPYMFPLFLVYAAEYTINQGVSPTLLFPLAESPFKQYRGFYPTYGAIYQIGVFLSRSSLPFIRIRSLYIPSLLQVLNLVVLGTHAMFFFIPSVWFVFIIIFWEGLLGGLVYVSTFAAVREEVTPEDREFSLGAVTLSDSVGICVAGFVGVALEKSLCSWQVHHGRDWCTRL